MSDEEKPLEFSARDLMPDWAQEKPREAGKDVAKRFSGDEARRESGGGGRRDQRGQRDQRHGGRRDQDRREGRHQDRREGHREGPRGGFGERGGRGERFDRDRSRGERREGGRPRGDRREGERGDRFPRGTDRGHEPPPAAGVTAAVEPSGPAIEGLNRHIRETFRSFPLSDLARLILESRERYRVRFTAAEPVVLYQCQADGSVWLTREEAIAHLLSGPALETYYTAEDIEVEAPTGNFSVIAVCGMSGVLLGPPNHHEYQRNIARLHRERFSDMPIERLKSRIRMESGEEVLEKWREQVCRVRRYRVRSAGEPSPVAEVLALPVEEPAEEAPPSAEPESAEPESAEAESEIEAEVGETAEAEPGEAAEVAGSPEAGEASAEAPEEDTGPGSGERPADAPKGGDGPVFKSIEEVARHFRQEFAAAAIAETGEAVVPGNIPGRLLSPGLLALLKQETEKLRRGFPLPLIQALCRAFEAKGLKFFKRGKKALHVAAIRPKALDENVILTDAIRAIIDYVKGARDATVAGLLEALVPGFKRPEGPAIEESAEWSDAARAVLKDLRWLTAEGYVLEFPDTGLALGRVSPESGAAPVVPASKAKAKGSRGVPTPPPVEDVASPAAGSPGFAAEERGDSGDDSGMESDRFPDDETDPDDPHGLPESVNPVETF